MSVSTESPPAASQSARSATAYPLRRVRLPRRPTATNLILTLILTSQLMVVLDATIVNVALHDIKSSLGFSTAGLSWVVNAYTLTFGGLLLLGARAGDILGRRRVFTGGIALFTVASLIGGFAQNPAELLTARAVQGMGGALASPSALALLMTMFPSPRERTRAIGLYTAVSIGGAALGLIAGGMLSEFVSWRWVLFVNVPIGVVLLALARPVLPETERQLGRFDLTGALTIGSFTAGLLLMAGFVRTELHAESPITPLRLFADRNRASSYLARLLLVAGMMGMFFFLTQFLRGVLGYSDLKTGFAFLPLTVAVFAASQLSARRLVDLVGAKSLMIIGITFSTLGMLWLTQLSESSSYLSLIGPLVVFGTGNGLAFVPLTTAALDGVEPRDAGAASGLVNVMQQVGGALGLAVLVTVFGSASSDAEANLPRGIAPAEAARRVYVQAADHAFWAATIFLVATWLLVAFAIRTRSEVTAD